MRRSQGGLGALGFDSSLEHLESSISDECTRSRENTSPNFHCAELFHAVFSHDHDVISGRVRQLPRNPGKRTKPILPSRHHTTQSALLCIPLCRRSMMRRRFCPQRIPNTSHQVAPPVQGYLLLEALMMMLAQNQSTAVAPVSNLYVVLFT